MVYRCLIVLLLLLHSLQQGKNTTQSHSPLSDLFAYNVSRSQRAPPATQGRVSLLRSKLNILQDIPNLPLPQSNTYSLEACTIPALTREQIRESLIHRKRQDIHLESSTDERLNCTADKQCLRYLTQRHTQKRQATTQLPYPVEFNPHRTRHKSTHDPTNNHQQLPTCNTQCVSHPGPPDSDSSLSNQKKTAQNRQTNRLAADPAPSESHPRPKNTTHGHGPPPSGKPYDSNNAQTIY